MQIQTIQQGAPRNPYSESTARFIRPEQLQTQSSIASTVDQHADNRGCCQWIAEIPRKICSLITWPFRAIRDAIYIRLPLVAIYLNPNLIVDRYEQLGGNEEAKNAIRERILEHLKRTSRACIDGLRMYYADRTLHPEKYSRLNSHRALEQLFAPEEMISAFETAIERLHPPQTPLDQRRLADLGETLNRFRHDVIILYR